jgi:diacylglycerol kinase family enzyme
MRHIFVINPHSFKAKREIETIISEITSCFFCEKTYAIHVSRYPRDAIAIVNRFISCGEDETVRVYAIGGDGILFDCLNGMVGFKNAELTSVPYGNANDTVRAFGEGHTEKFRDIKNLIAAPSRPMDIISCGSNYALTELNIGIIGQTMITAAKFFPKIPHRFLKRHIGLAYSVCAIGALLNKEIMNQSYKIFADGEDLSGSYCNIHVANGACNGGTLVPSPYAKPDDGILEIIMANTNNFFTVSKALSQYTSGKFEKFDFFIYRRCKKLEVKSDAFLRLEMDGEGLVAHELNLEVIPGGIKFFAPEGLEFADYSHRANQKGGLK